MIIRLKSVLKSLITHSSGFECNRLWVLKNSLTKKCSKKLCNREALQATFSVLLDIFYPKISAALRKMEFFNGHI